MKREQKLNEDDQYILTLLREMIQHHRARDSKGNIYADALTAHLDCFGLKQQADYYRGYIAIGGMHLDAIEKAYSDNKDEQGDADRAGGSPV